MGGQRWHFLICLLTYFVLLISYFNLLFHFNVLLLFHGKVIQATLTGYRQQCKLMDKSVCVLIPHWPQGYDVANTTKDIWVSWSGRVRAVSGFALSLMLRDKDRDLDREFLRPREPGL